MRARTFMMMAVCMAALVLGACSSDSAEPPPTVGATTTSSPAPFPPTVTPTALPPVNLRLTRGSFDEEAPFAGVFVLNLTARTWLHIEEASAEAPVQPLRLIATSPDGQMIALGTSANEVRILTAQGEEVRSWPRIRALVGAFSPDGRFLALPQSSAAVVLDIESGVVFQTDIVGSVGDVVWSPDSNQLLLRAGGGPGPLVDGEIHIYSLSTGNTQFVSPGLYPGWSPRGDRIGFIDGGVLKVLGLDGDLLSSWEPADSNFRLTGFSWSTDGSKLFVSMRTLLDERGLAVAGVVDAGTGMLDYTITGTGGVSTSPDGDLLGVTGNFCGDSAVFLFEPDGTGLTQLTSVSHTGAWVWSPDGENLLVSEGRRLMLVPIAGGQSLQTLEGPAIVRGLSWRNVDIVTLYGVSVAGFCEGIPPQTTEIIFAENG